MGDWVCGVYGAERRRAPARAGYRLASRAPGACVRAPDHPDDFRRPVRRRGVEGSVICEFARGEMWFLRFAKNVWEK
jgi:hypothetical protein